MNKGTSLNDASSAALLSLIAGTEDTNMIRRGGREEAEKRRREAEALSRELKPEDIEEKIGQLDEDYIRHHLSPGGSADLLALSLFFFFAEQERIVVKE